MVTGSGGAGVLVADRADRDDVLQDVDVIAIKQIRLYPLVLAKLVPGRLEVGLDVHLQRVIANFWTVQRGNSIVKNTDYSTVKRYCRKNIFSAANVQADLVIIRSVILVVGDTSVDKSLLQIVLLCITLSMDWLFYSYIRRSGADNGILTLSLSF